VAAFGGRGRASREGEKDRSLEAKQGGQGRARNAVGTYDWGLQLEISLKGRRRVKRTGRTVCLTIGLMTVDNLAVDREVVVVVAVTHQHNNNILVVG
jgi:hypothetical protein